MSITPATVTYLPPDYERLKEQSESARLSAEDNGLINIMLEKVLDVAARHAEWAKMTGQHDYLDLLPDSLHLAIQHGEHVHACFAFTIVNGIAQYAVCSPNLAFQHSSFKIWADVTDRLVKLYPVEFFSKSLDLLEDVRNIKPHTSFEKIIVEHIVNRHFQEIHAQFGSNLTGWISQRLEGMGYVQAEQEGRTVFIKTPDVPSSVTQNLRGEARCTCGGGK